MKKLTRDDYIRLVEHEYFGNVVAGKLDKVLACFTDDVGVTIRHGDNPLRTFNKDGSGEASKLVEFYRHLCGNFTPWFGDFVHYIDVDEHRCACTFVVRLTPKADSLYIDAGVQTLRNCNFFSFRDNKISAMTIYYSNTESGLAQAPTGYPKESGIR